LRAAYKPTFENLLPSLAKQINGRDILKLDIGIALSQPYPTTDPASRTHTFPEFQKLVGEVYTLVCIVAAQHQIDLDIPGGLDVRVILLEPATNNSSKQPSKPLSGPLIDLPSLIPSLPRSTTIYTVESETGISLANTFTHLHQLHHKSSPTIHRLPCGPSLTTTTSQPPTESLPLTPSHSHKSTVVGGTFDHLHIGHKLLLTFTIFLASPLPATTPRKITVGITNDALLANKKHASVLESWEVRQQRTAEFVEGILVFASADDVQRMRKQEFFDEPGPNGKVVRVTYSPILSASEGEGEVESEIVINYTSISDVFGPTITDEDISAMVISAETRAGGKAVNENRKGKGWRELEVFEVDILDASPGDGEEERKVKEGFENKISSTEIRRRMVEMEEGAKRERDGKL
jgi:phosphopantetheine adenylyltransferase